MTDEHKSKIDKCIDGASKSLKETFPSFPIHMIYEATKSCVKNIYSIPEKAPKTPPTSQQNIKANPNIGR